MSVPSVTMMASIGVRYLATPSIAFFILGTFWLQEGEWSHRCSTMKTPAMTTGVSVPTAFRDAGKCIISVGRQVDAGSVCQCPLKVATNTDKLTINCGMT